MATRLYPLNQAAPYTPATVRGTWDATGSLLTRKLGTAKVAGDTITSVVVGETSTTNNYKSAVLRFVSDGLPGAKTFTASDTLEILLGVQENSNAANDKWRVTAYITEGDSDTVRGYLVQDWEGTEWSTTARFTSTGALTCAGTVSAQTGDRIVIVVGYVAANTSNAAYTSTFWYGAPATASDGVATGVNYATLNGWIEFSQSDLFTAPSGSAYGLDVDFSTADPNPVASPYAGTVGEITPTDLDSRLSVSDGRLQVSNAVASATWLRTMLWSQLIADLGSASAVFRLAGNDDDGPALLIAPNTTGVNPESAGYGLYIKDQVNLRPAGQTNNVLSGYPATYPLGSHDVMLTLIRRSGGGYLGLITDQNAAARGQGRIISVWGSDDITGAAAVGVEALAGAFGIDRIKALTRAELPTGYDSRYPLSSVGDDFTEATGSIAGRSTPVGSKVWAVTGGTATAGSGAVTKTAGTYFEAVYNPGSAQRIVSATFQTAATAATTGFLGLIVRGNSDSTDYLEIWLDAGTNTYGVWHKGGGANLANSTGNFTVPLSSTVTITCYDDGSTLDFWVNGQRTASGVSIPSEHASLYYSGVLLENGSSANACQVLDIASYTSDVVTLDTTLGEIAAPPARISETASITDAFTGTDGTALSTYNSDWTAVSGTWEVRSGKARLTAAAAKGFAVRESSLTDVEVAATIVTPNTTPTYPVDWFPGLVARWTDSSNYIYARFLYQTNSPEVEVWQYSGGTPTLIGFVNLGAGNLAANTTHALRLAVKGSEVAAYLDGYLVVQATTTVTTGTKVGLGVNDSGTASGQPTFDDFAAYQTAEVTSVDLVVADSAHSHSVDAPVLTQASTLAVGNSDHVHSAAAVVLTQVHSLAVADATHVHTVAAPALTQAHAITVADSGHAHSVDAPALTQAHSLAVAASDHVYTAEGVTLGASDTLAVADVAHAHSTASPVLTQLHNLIVADASHQHSADAVLLTQAHSLNVQSSDHGQANENVTLAFGLTLTVADVAYAHTSEAAGLAQDHVLSVDAGTHQTTAESIALSQWHALIAADVSHVHTADEPSLSGDYALNVASVSHEVAIDGVVVTEGGAIVPTVLVAVLARTLNVAVHARTLDVATQARVTEVEVRTR